MNIKGLYEKYKDVIPYLFFGGCTTVVNVVTSGVLAHGVKVGTMPSTIIAWVIAVFFAYITNRRGVCHSEAKTSKEVIREIFSFLGCRITTGVVDWACMYIFTDVFKFNDIFVKISANVLVIILNYVASKLIIFRRGREGEE